jgi:type II secretion system protein D
MWVCAAVLTVAVFGGSALAENAPPPAPAGAVEAPPGADVPSGATEGLPGTEDAGPAGSTEVPPGFEEAGPPAAAQGPPDAEEAPPGAQDVPPGAQQGPPGAAEAPPGADVTPGAEVSPGAGEAPPGAFEGPPEAGSGADEDDTVLLSLPESVELKTLIEYVSKRLGINIIYDEAIGKERLAITSPQRIPQKAVLGVLKRALAMSGLELVDTEDPAWKTIGRRAAIRFVHIHEMDAEELAQQAGALLQERQRVRQDTGAGAAARVAAATARGAGTQRAAGGDVTLLADRRTNRIVIVGIPSAVEEAADLVQSLDVPAGVVTRTYRLRYIVPERIDSLVRSRLNAAEPKTRYASTMDEVSGLLIVTAPEKAQVEVARLVEGLDVSDDPSASTLEFYPLINTTAADVLATIRSLLASGAEGAETVRKPAVPKGTGGREHFTGPNLPPTPGTLVPPKPPAYQETPPEGSPPEGGAPATVVSETAPAAGDGSMAESSALARQATVTADTNTNTIIVVAPPAVQRLYKRLIAALDKRRPQVLVRVILVSIDTTDNFSLGVEISGFNRRPDGSSFLTFSAFGLSTVDPVSGALAITPGVGFNAAILDPGSVDIVIRALEEDVRAHVLAAPEILVNDNATASLASVAEAPFTSVNASDTVSTTSFAGYASAGTTVDVTPHISEGDYLQLQYSITLNSFTGAAADGIPPPRLTDTVSSEVTVPNGYAVIVGGLRRKDVSDSVSKIPWLGDIPILKHLFQLQTQSDVERTLFVFIRPIILRDDQFEDLKYLSDRDLNLAELPPNMPASRPIVMP